MVAAIGRISALHHQLSDRLLTALRHHLTLCCLLQELFANIDVAMGGKAAEELIFGADKVPLASCTRPCDCSEGRQCAASATDSGPALACCGRN